MSNIHIRHAMNNINFDVATPRYHQIYTILRNQIMNGVYLLDSLIPSENELAKMYEVSRITARRALDELAAEGLVKRQRGLGTRVIFNIKHSRPVSGKIEGLLENLLALGLNTNVKVIEFDYVPANIEVADALKVELGQKVQRAVRIREMKKVPFSYVVTYVPEKIGLSFSEEDLLQEPMLALLERTNDVHINRAIQTITATLADNIIAKHLKIQAGSALLKVERIVYDQDDRPVEYIIVCYSPEKYQLKLNLTRDHTDTSNIWSQHIN